MKTPLDKFSVVDVVRGTLGVGPCQYILDVEGQQAQFKGRPTCAARDYLDEIYEDGEQVLRKADVEQALDDVLAFMRLIRGRIQDYVAFSRDLSGYLADSKARHPELAGFIDEMERYNVAVLRAYEGRRKGIRAPSYADDLVERFRRDVVGYTAPDALEKCQEITEEFTHIGDNQDELVSECRVAVKVLRQQAALALQTDPETADLVREIRHRTRQVLRSPASYEGARH